MKTNGFIRTGKDRTILDFAVNEAYKIGLNKPTYTLTEIVSHIFRMKMEDEFKNLIALHEKTPGIKLYNCGGMPVIVMPYDDTNDKKKKKNKIL